MSTRTDNAYARAGLCWACPTGLGTTPEMHNLCQLLPGFSLSDAATVVERLPIPSIGEDIAISMREPQLAIPPGGWNTLLPLDTVLGRRRRLLTLNLTAAAPPETAIDDADNNETALRIDAAPASSSSSSDLVPVYEACRVGYYNPGGAARCLSCPYGTSTRGKGATRRAQCECMPGYINTSTGVCRPCPANTFRSVLMPPDACVPCAPLETTFGRIAQSTCACSAGYVRSAPRACSACAANHFCTPCWSTQARACPSTGTWSTPCMPGGTSPPASTSLLNCTCASNQSRLLRPGVAIGGDPPDNRALYCLPTPPHATYDPATMRLTCPHGWTAITLVSGQLAGCSLCGAGRYFNSTARLCRPCPLGNYSGRVDAMDACTPCGPGLTTLAIGASSDTNCTCPLGTTRDPLTLVCKGCTLTQYALPGGGCAACPPMTTSIVDARSIRDCRCSPGFTLTLVDDGDAHGCTPCPVGTFSARAGNSPCTSCGIGRTTRGVGHASASDCVCAPGWNATGIMGICRRAVVAVQPIASVGRTNTNNNNGSVS